MSRAGGFNEALTCRMAGPLVRTWWIAARPMRSVSCTHCPSTRALRSSTVGLNITHFMWDPLRAVITTRQSFSEVPKHGSG